MLNTKPFFNSAVAFFVLLFPIFFLTIKSWTNVIFFGLFIFVLIHVRHHFFAVFRKRTRRFWILFFCLIAPFCSEVIAQIGRGVFVGSSLDGPARSVFAALIFAVISRDYSGDLLSKRLVLGSLVSIIVTTISIVTITDHYWGARAATYFVDPITLPCFLTSLLGIFLMNEFRDSNYWARSKLIKFICLMCVAYVALESSSRSSWVALIFLVELLILVKVGRSFRQQLIVHTLFALTVVCIFFSNERVKERVSEAATGVVEWAHGGGQNKSSAQRIVMAEIDLELIKRAPWFGTQDGEMPSFDDLHSRYPVLTEEIYEIKALAGSHNEYSAQLVRKGLPWGGLCIVAMFIYPLMLCGRGLFSKHPDRVRISVVGLGLIVPIMISALTIQVFNLKMTASFYQLALAIIFCDLYRVQTRGNNSPH